MTKSYHTVSTDFSTQSTTKPIERNGEILEGAHTAMSHTQTNLNLQCTRQASNGVQELSIGHTCFENPMQYTCCHL